MSGRRGPMDVWCWPLRTLSMMREWTLHSVIRPLMLHGHYEHCRWWGSGHSTPSTVDAGHNEHSWGRGTLRSNSSSLEIIHGSQSQSYWFSIYSSAEMGLINRSLISKGKVFYGQEPPSGESTITECGVNYQQLAVIYWSSPMGNSSCSRPQLATDNGIRDGRSNWLMAPPTVMGSTIE